VQPDRINIFERWESRAAVEAFRGTGPSDEQRGAMLSASVAEYEVAATDQLT
jgi:quinol monooxygenase YgiN